MDEVEFDRFNHEPQKTPMTKINVDLSKLLAKKDGGDCLRSVAEAVLLLIMEADVEGLIGAGKHERNAECALNTRLGTLNPKCPNCGSAVTSPASWNPEKRQRKCSSP